MKDEEALALAVSVRDYYAGMKMMDMSAIEQDAEKLAGAVIRLHASGSREQGLEGVWLVWAHEHHGFWRQDRCGYVPNVRAAGRFTFEEALAIVQQGNIGMSVIPEETMVPLSAVTQRERLLARGEQGKLREGE